MFDFKGVTHVIENPKGHAPGYNYSLVGSVPITMLEPREPTTADVMAGRVQPNGKAYGGRKWERIEQILLPFAEYPYRLETAADAHFDQLEQWHTDHGTIDQEIG